MNGKWFKGFLFCLVAFLVFSGNAAAQEFTLRFNTTSSPNEVQTLGMNKFAEVVGEMSGGKIDVKVFHSGQLGDQKTSLLGIMKGSLEMSSDGSPAWFADLANMPEIGVYEAPYLYKDVDHMYRVLTGKDASDAWEELAKKSGIRVLDIWYMGTRELNLTKRVKKINTPDDLNGVKLRVPNAEAWINMGKSLGASPTPMGFGEVYMALKTGTVDGQDNPVPTSYEEKFFEVTKYVVLTDHMLGYVMPVISEKVWQKMPDNYKYYIKQAMMVARNYQNQLVMEKEATLLGKAASEYGIEVIIPDKEAFREKVSEFYSSKEFDKKWGRNAYKKVLNVQ